MRGLARHLEFASTGTSIGNAVGRPHFLIPESGITTVTGGPAATSTVFSVNSQVEFHSMRTDDSIDFYFGTGRFTVEFWIYIPSASPNQTGQTRILSFPNVVDTVGGVPIVVSQIWVINWTGTEITILKENTTGPSDIAVAYTGNRWLHIAAVRSGTEIQFFIDGTLVNYDPAEENYAGTYINFGGIYGEQDPFPDDFQTNYFLDDIRIVKNQAVYTANFSPIPRQSIYNTANTMAFFSVGVYGFSDDINTDDQDVVIADGYAPDGYVTINV